MARKFYRTQQRAVNSVNKNAKLYRGKGFKYAVISKSGSGKFKYFDVELKSNKRYARYWKGDKVIVLPALKGKKR